MMGSHEKEPVNGQPLREWTVEVHLVDDNGNDKPARVFEKVVYNLHPTFPKPVQGKSPTELGY